MPLLQRRDTNSAGPGWPRTRLGLSEPQGSTEPAALPSAAPLLLSPTMGSRLSGSPSAGPEPRLTCLGLWLRQLLLCGRDGFCSFARHFCVNKGKKKNHTGLAAAPRSPRRAAFRRRQWALTNATAHRGLGDQPVPRAARLLPAPVTTTRTQHRADGSGSHATPWLGPAVAYAALPPPPCPAAASAASPRRAEPSPRGRPGVALSELPWPHRGPRPLRRCPPAFPPVPAALPAPRGGGWRRMAAATLTVREAEPKMAAERDQAAEGATSGKRITSGGEARRTSARPPRRLRSGVPGHVRTFRGTRTGAVPREREFCPAPSFVPREPHPFCPPGTRTRG